MGRATINEQSLYNIGDAIRNLINEDDRYYPSQMAGKINSAEGGGKSFKINVIDDDGNLSFDKNRLEILTAINNAEYVMAIYDNPNVEVKMYPYISTYNGILIFSNITCHNVYEGSTIKISGYALFYNTDDSILFYHVDTEFATSDSIDGKVDSYVINATNVGSNWQFNTGRNYSNIKSAIDSGKYVYIVATIAGKTKTYPYVYTDENDNLVFGYMIPLLDVNTNTTYILKNTFTCTPQDNIIYESIQYAINASSGGNSSSNNVGENVYGQNFSINNINVVAGINAERFNDYTNNKPTGANSHAEGYRTIAQGANSHAEGNETVSKGVNSHAEGYNNKSNGNHSHAEGYNNTSSATASHSEGSTNVASGLYSHAEGYNNTSSAESSHSEGKNTIASGNYSHSEGLNTEAQGDKSHSEGVGTIAEGENQHVQGKYNIPDPSNKYANIIGNGTDNNNRSNASTTSWEGVGWFKDISLGGDDEESGESVLESITNKVGKTYKDEHFIYDNRVYIIPKSAEVFNDYDNNRALGDYSDSKGYDTKAVGFASHAEGNQCEAIGPTAHAEGTACKSIGYASHTEGVKNNAHGLGSHAEGINNSAFVSGQHVEGRYAEPDEDGRFIHIVGAGTGNSNRKTIHVIDTNGRTWYADDVCVGGTIDDPSITMYGLLEGLTRMPCIPIVKCINTSENEFNFNDAISVEWNSKYIIKNELTDNYTITLNIQEAPNDSLTSQIVIVIYTGDNNVPTISGLNDITIVGDQIGVSSRYELVINEEMFAIAKNYSLLP